MKKRYSPVFCVCCIIVLAFSAHALDTLRVETVCTDGHLLVPARDILDDLGAHILWSPATRTVTVRHGDTEIVMQVGYPQALVNGESRQLQVPPVLSEGRVFIPLRFVAEALGYEVAYTDGEVDLVSGETIVRRIIPAEGPPRCVLDDATEPAAVGEDAVEPPQPEQPEKPEAVNRPMDCDIGGFEKTVLRSDAPVLVDFWAPWCGPCLMMHPTLDRISRRYAGEVKVVRIDISKSCNQPLVQQYNIRSIPYLAVFSDGVVVEHLVGARPEQEIAAALDRVLQD